MRAASKFVWLPKKFGRDRFHVGFELCSLLRFIETFIACIQFGVGSISKDTLTEQPAGRAGTEERCCSKNSESANV
jgi:hypothetical protein